MNEISLTHNTGSPQTVPEITPSEFARVLETGDRVQILDVRGQAGMAVGLIPEESVVHIVGSRLRGYSDLAQTGLDPATPVVVICAHGNDSKAAAAYLNRLGANARSLTGGVAAWMMLSVPRVLPTPPSLDVLLQFDRVGKEALSYLLVSSGEALIIDPPRDSSLHRRAIEEAGARLVAVADTHVHADYISGASGIGRELRIPYYLHPADSIYPYDNAPGRLKITPVSEGMTIRLGRCPIVAHHTPGHSPGSVTYLLGHDAAFTGDFLFIGSIGRPDLADRTEEWASQLWKSIQTAKNRWPADLMIYPAHYTAQTPRGSNGAIGDSFGNLLHRNSSLCIREQTEFLRWITAKPAAAPAAYRTIKAVNIGLRSVDEQEADMLEIGRNECAVGGI